MRRSIPAWGGLGAALLLLATGCGGSGGGANGVDGVSAQSQEDSVVVGYDHNGNGALDILTLDLSTDPLVILEALEGDGQGGYIDRTDTLAGQPIDAALSASIKDYLSSTIELGAETQLELTDTSGNSVLVVLYQ